MRRTFLIIYVKRGWGVDVAILEKPKAHSPLGKGNLGRARKGPAPARPRPSNRTLTCAGEPRVEGADAGAGGVGGGRGD